jgi:hypothetical protein
MAGSEFPTQFSAERRELFRRALIGAYEDAAEVCDPERGFNDLLHGLIVYHLTGFRLQRLVADVPGVQFEHGSFGPELHIEGFRVRWNKVGRDSREGIENSFPRSSMAASYMAEANHQLTLWDPEDGNEPTNWILAHFGNPRDGLVRAYLAAPIATNGREVVGWARWIPIYDAAQPMIDLPEAPMPGLPVAIAVAPAELSLIDLSAFDHATETGS